MPCEKCEKKWGKIITPEVWKAGAKSSHSKSKLNENKYLTKGTNRFDPMKKEKMKSCRICKKTLHQKGAHFCSTCAFQKGICMMCGKRITSVKDSRMSLV
ncbi:unnamed protein product [Oikopleura dioica]|uniref:Cysteine-rich PDZ-binding protein n=1 Tax=Oikopleura dioica TaxID=34765 RepID=E4XY05_OIKDI|nr:unnamed protein product [Oikopleura dioica]